MDLILQQQLEKDPKMSELLKENSYWFKQLNRDRETYKDFVTAMKEKYHLRFTDKVSTAIDQIDFVSSILETLK